jgi:transcriptional regulator with XRE-family HTH domain
MKQLLNNKELGNRLKAVRTTLGLTLEELAKEIDTNKVNLSRYESGLVTPNNNLYYHLALKGINLNWLFTGSGNMYIDKDADYISMYEELDKDKQEVIKRVVSGLLGGC